MSSRARRLYLNSVLPEVDVSMFKQAMQAAEASASGKLLQMRPPKAEEISLDGPDGSAVTMSTADPLMQAMMAVMGWAGEPMKSMAIVARLFALSRAVECDEVKPWLKYDDD